MKCLTLVFLFLGLCSDSFARESSFFDDRPQSFREYASRLLSLYLPEWNDLIEPLTVTLTWSESVWLPVKIGSPVRYLRRHEHPIRLRSPWWWKSDVPSKRNRLYDLERGEEDFTVEGYLADSLVHSPSSSGERYRLVTWERHEFRYVDTIDLSGQEILETLAVLHNPTPLRIGRFFAEDYFRKRSFEAIDRFRSESPNYSWDYLKPTGERVKIWTLESHW